MSMETTKKMRALLKNEGYIIAPCAFDALSAKAIEWAGFEMAGTTGQGIHACQLGMPDNGLLTFNENLDVCSKLADAVNIPVIADAEGGYGNAMNTMRTVRQFEKGGIAGVFIEDQKLPPNCPFIKKPQLISINEMSGKIQAACAARTDPNFLIIARTDALYDEGVERAQAYIEAGADMIKPEPRNRKELELWPQKVKAPLHMGYMADRGVTDGMSAKEIGEMGYKIISFPLTMLNLYATTIMKYLKNLRETSSDTAFLKDMMPFEDFQKFIGTDDFLKLSNKYVRP